MSDHRVVTQYRLLFLEHVISCHSPQPNYSRRAAKYFCVAFVEGFGFEQFLKHGTGTLPTNCFDIIRSSARPTNTAVSFCRRLSTYISAMTSTVFITV